MFLEPSELKTHIYGEVVGAISNGDITLLPDAIAAAITEAVFYFDRFDIDDLLSKTGTDRDPLLLLCMKNLAKWHFIVLGTPDIDYEDAEKRYTQSVSWLVKVQGSKGVPYGWKLKSDPILASEFKVDSNQVKRSTHY